MTNKFVLMKEKIIHTKHVTFLVVKADLFQKEYFCKSEYLPTFLPIFGGISK